MSSFVLPMRIPSLFIHCDHDAIKQMLAEDDAATATTNDQLNDDEGHPPWLSESPGHVTIEGFVNDTMSYLAEIADGARDSVLQLQTPNQAMQVCIRLSHIEVHPFVQKRLAALPASSRLARVHSVSQIRECDAPERGTSLLAPPPAPHRQAFCLPKSYSDEAASQSGVEQVKMSGVP